MGFKYRTRLPGLLIELVAIENNNVTVKNVPLHFSKHTNTPTHIKRKLLYASLSPFTWMK